MIFSCLNIEYLLKHSMFIVLFLSFLYPRVFCYIFLNNVIYLLKLYENIIIVKILLKIISKINSTLPYIVMCKE